MAACLTVHPRRVCCAGRDEEQGLACCRQCLWFASATNRGSISCWEWFRGSPGKQKGADEGDRTLALSALAPNCCSCIVVDHSCIPLICSASVEGECHTGASQQKQRGSTTCWACRSLSPPPSVPVSLIGCLSDSITTPHLLQVNAERLLRHTTFDMLHTPFHSSCARAWYAYSPRPEHGAAHSRVVSQTTLFTGSAHLAAQTYRPRHCSPSQ